ncbi:hypothetical protein G6F31_018254 [Rhizopus arrhizus]|nr:hypothetical protein G6F31_018254 [Rhizopus arrhizus]
MGHIPGVILGALILAALTEFLRAVVEPFQHMVFGAVILDPEGIRMLLFGLAMVCVMLFRPAGLWPAAVRKRPGQALRRPASLVGSQFRYRARRDLWADRPERRGQDHADQPVVGRTAARRRRGHAGGGGCLARHRAGTRGAGHVALLSGDVGVRQLHGAGKRLPGGVAQAPARAVGLDCAARLRRRGGGGPRGPQRLPA